MKIATMRRPRTEERAGVSGVARLDRRTKRLINRLNPGDIAIIDHADLDRVAADSLVAAKVSAVINAQPSISGRYPNLGPEVLAKNGIVLLDNVGAEVFAAVKEGTRVRIEDDTVYIGDEAVATGIEQDGDSIAELMSEAKAGLSTQLEAFASNTMEYMRRERALLLDGVGVPEIRTRIEGRHVMVVVRGYDYKDDLRALRHYIREFRPVLIGVDGGADALRAAGYKPDIVIGDMDSVSDEVLRGGAEVVVHAYPDGRAPGLERIQDLGIEATTFSALGTSEDIAMLLADEKGASIIVAVGSHANLVEFLDKGRGGMASTFLTRLRVGGKLIDAKGVNRLYQSRISSASLLLLVLAAMVAIGATLAVSTAGQTYLDIVGDRLDRLVDWLQGVFS
ncbi:MAG: putative cytokinetic ring protein SteA [Actinomycetota bacterium]|nr:putative cytokinetic ring protein SteA [Actinomycetota bacterium]